MHHLEGNEIPAAMSLNTAKIEENYGALPSTKYSEEYGIPASRAVGTATQGCITPGTPGLPWVPRDPGCLLYTSDAADE